MPEDERETHYEADDETIPWDTDRDYPLESEDDDEEE